MNQQTTGPTNYSTDQKIEKHLEDIRAYEQKLGLNINSIPYDSQFYQKILCFNLENLARLSISECAEYSVLLQQYSIYVLRCYNEFKSICNILTSKIDIIIASEIQRYSGSWDVQKQQAINGNSAATELNNLLINYKTRCDRLQDLHKYISAYSDSIRNLQFAKIKEVSHE